MSRGETTIVAKIFIMTRGADVHLMDAAVDDQESIACAAPGFQLLV
jgi:hypothetical protein